MSTRTKKSIAGIAAILITVGIGSIIAVFTQLDQAPQDSSADPLPPVQCGDTTLTNIDFESPGGMSPTEGMAISTQYDQDLYVSFRNGRIRAADGTDFGACPSPVPVLAQVGDPATAYTSQSLGNTGDGVLPEYATRNGSWFLTDDGVDGGINLPCELIIDFSQPTTEYSFDLLDVDDSENWVIESYDIDNNLVYTTSVQQPDQAFDSTPIRVQVPTQSTPIWQIVVRAGQPKPDNIGWGLAFDNFSPICALDDPTIEPLGINKTGTIVSQDVNSATINYILEVTNTNSTTINDVLVLDQLPSFVQSSDFTNLTTYNTTFNDTNSTVLWEIGAMSPGTIQLEYQIVVDSANFGPVDNTAAVYVDANQNGIPEISEKNTEATENLVLSTIAPLQIVKTGVVSEVNSRQARLSYSLEVTNPNDFDMTNVYVLDLIQSFIEQADFTDGSTYTFNFDSGNNQAEWNVGTIGANSSITINYDIIIDSSNYGTIPNTAEVYVDDSTDGILDAAEKDGEDSESLVVAVLDPVGITKNGQLTAVDSVSGTIDYVINVSNPNSIPVEDVIVEDQLPNFVAADDIQNTSSFNLSYNDATQIATWTVGTVPASSSVDITYTLTVDSANYGDIPNTASVFVDRDQNSITDPSEKEGEASELVPISVDTTAGIDKSKQVSTTDSQVTVTYTIVARNLGDVDLVNIYVEDELPAGYDASWVSDITPTSTVVNSVITWDPITLAPSATSEFSYVVTIPRTSPGTYNNTANLYNQVDELLASDDETVTVTAPPPPPSTSTRTATSTSSPSAPLPETGLFDDEANYPLMIGLLLMGTGILVNRLWAASRETTS